ncbi:MAG TPA: hypothetical protein VFE18_15020 [Phenylobacterium sp.]|jgi:hypothetical protein|uniref:hypothetical protein n=1 Tax=Phenylobacterium sp. TaxID=1871053 RepID=UPI002D36BF3E|nr:hypothetical protein [Phenylobacterium sp.]HZZ69482.1 hypothetical protein [Phenylobacterium sp.]
MISRTPVRRPAVSRALPALLAATLATMLAACSSPAPPPPPPPPAPVAVVIPPVSLSSKVVEQAAAYRAYVAHASAISTNFTDGSDVAQSLKTGEAYEPGQFLRGAIAYGAIVALQDPAFVAGVRKYVADPDQRRSIAYEIMKDPAYAVSFSGSASAAGLVMSALGDDGKKLIDLGRDVHQAAYDVQHQAWSKADVQARDSRLALAKSLSSTPGLGEVAETQRLQTAVSGAGQMGLTPQSAEPPYTPEVIHSLAVAALAALGYADDASLAQVMPILAEPTEAVCLNMAKLNLYQCLAVARPHYEDVFCLGQHGLEDTGSCLMKGVGVPEPVDLRAQAAAQAALQKASTTTTAHSRHRKKQTN